jgi:putative membrane protein
MKMIPAACLALATLCVTSAWSQASGPTDAQIAAIVVTANQVDIDAGNLAKSKASASDVKDFAQLMVTDHTAVNKSASDLVSRLHVTPEPNTTSRSLEAGGDQNLATLKKLSGPAFDKAYVDHEVAYHQAVLDAVDQTLIPNAKNPELKALLVKVRPAFVAHLEHAKTIQSGLNKTVSIEGMSFNPRALTVSRGARIVWTNKDIVPHTVRANTRAFDSGSIAPNATWLYVADRPGTYSYACAYHPTMTASLRVLP